MLEQGEVFAGFTVERLLGQGGMGSVYLARHPRTGKRTALKLLNRELFTDQQVRARFEREADLVAQLDHPGIIAVYDRGSENDQLWISMQYIDGVDAASVNALALPPERAVQIIEGVAEALDYAHGRGVLHRDVKPANILLARASKGKGERVYLSDFGIARLREDTTHLTQTGMFTATLAYASPEQMTGAPLGNRSDQYSLACALYWLLTGVGPFDADNPADIIHGHLNLAPVPVTRRRPGLNPAMDLVLAAGLAKLPEHRYRTCAEFAAAARKALTAVGPPPLPEPFPPGYPQQAPAGHPRQAPGYGPVPPGQPPQAAPMPRVVRYQVPPPLPPHGAPVQVPPVARAAAPPGSSGVPGPAMPHPAEIPPAAQPPVPVSSGAPAARPIAASGQVAPAAPSSGQAGAPAPALPGAGVQVPPGGPSQISPGDVAAGQTSSRGTVPVPSDSPAPGAAVTPPRNSPVAGPGEAGAAATVWRGEVSAGPGVEPIAEDHPGSERNPFGDSASPEGRVSLVKGVGEPDRYGGTGSAKPAGESVSEELPAEAVAPPPVASAPAGGMPNHYDPVVVGAGNEAAVLRPPAQSGFAPPPAYLPNPGEPQRRSFGSAMVIAPLILGVVAVVALAVGVFVVVQTRTDSAAVPAHEVAPVTSAPSRTVASDPFMMSRKAFPRLLPQGSGTEGTGYGDTTCYAHRPEEKLRIDEPSLSAGPWLIAWECLAAAGSAGAMDYTILQYDSPRTVEDVLDDLPPAIESVGRKDGEPVIQRVWLETETRQSLTSTAELVVAFPADSPRGSYLLYAGHTGASRHPQAPLPSADEQLVAWWAQAPL